MSRQSTCWADREIRHVIFDCFGTLIDTGAGSLQAVEEILFHIGADLSAEKFYSEWKRIKKRMMSSSSGFRNEKTLFEDSLSEMFTRYKIKADASVEVKPMIRSLFAERTCFPDTKKTLKNLSDRGVDIAIGSTTDTDSLIHYLEQNKLHISHIFTSEEMEVYKPDIRFYNTILNKTGWSVKECLFVGDSYMDDVCGPKQIGMKAVLLDRKGLFNEKEFDPQPDFYIDSLSRLVDIVIRETIL